MLNDDRAIVSNIPGTTRDIVSEKIAIGENVLKICDTAGLRDTATSEIEQIGIAKAIDVAKTADLFLIVLNVNDGRLPLLPQDLVHSLKKSNTVVICNKMDLPQNCRYEDFLPDFLHIAISLKTEESPSKLKKDLQNFIAQNITLKQPMDAIVNARHLGILKRVYSILGQYEKHSGSDIQPELVASDLRCALETLGEITGAYDVEKMLDAIFSNFCIGK